MEERQISAGWKRESEVQDARVQAMEEMEEAAGAAPMEVEQ